MIVIKASGAPDVKALRRLATELSATSLSADDIDLAPEAVTPPPPRRRRGPTVSTLPAAAISPQTQAALLDLKPVAIEESGEYLL
ncbi:MAG: hypothetical protein DCC69_00355 [Hyphomicrobiales bacterium]|nr:MAG: hypothetical protein DCC69_00355 [Hyphomicrobiales bacterium]